MPTYDYECINCGRTVEIFHKINEEPPIKECPDCKGILRRLISCGAGLIFKGTGFYITDYKRKNSEQNTNTKKENKSENLKSDKNKSDTDK